MKRKITWLVLGVFFGMALSKVGASDFQKIYGMFTLEDLTLMGVMATAIPVGIIGMQILRLSGNKTIGGQPVKIDYARLTWRHIVGGLIFGVGWAMTGACPGTVVTQVGEGKLLSLFSFAGLLAGTYIFAIIVEKTPNLWDY